MVFMLLLGGSRGIATRSLVAGMVCRLVVIFCGGRQGERIPRALGQRPGVGKLLMFLAQDGCSRKPGVLGLLP